MNPADIKRLLDGGELDPQIEAKAFNLLAKKDPLGLAHLCQVMSSRRRRLRTDLKKALDGRAKAEAQLERILIPPLYPAIVLQCLAEGRFDVLCGGRRQVVIARPEVSCASLRPGDEVFLNQAMALIVGRGSGGPRVGRVTTIAERIDDRILIHGLDGERIAVLCDPELAAELQVGDRVTCLGEFPCIVERLPAQRESAFRLEVPPTVTFEDIGGLDEIIEEMRRDLDLHLLHPEVAEQYGLRPLKGITLVGAPGVGKTMLAKAIAAHVAATAPETRFLDVKPGALRCQYYGQSEERIRDLFAAARSAPGLVVIFFDELDHFGRRGDGIGEDIDGRVLGALLAEIDGIRPTNSVLCVGATNRLDLIDEATVRSGRFGDRIYQIPRPGREGTREILAHQLTPELPYAQPPYAHGGTPRMRARRW